jgi:hypothetical protein
VADLAISAAICSSRSLALATRNIKDFAGLGVVLVDPWSATTEVELERHASLRVALVSCVTRAMNFHIQEFEEC